MTIFPLIRPFIRTAGLFANRFRSPRAHLAAPSTLQADLRWISELLHVIPNTLPLAQTERCRARLCTARQYITLDFYQSRLALRDEDGADTRSPLVLYLHGVLQCLPPHQSRILVRSDYMGVVHTVNNGRSRSAAFNDVLKRIYSLLVPACL